MKTQFKSSFIYTTHQLEEIEEICDELRTILIY
jgi:ABC-type multidrug transport system ATPase subunit